jgi:hypothetical protein
MKRQNQTRHFGHIAKCRRLRWKSVAIPDGIVLPIRVCNDLDLPSDSRCRMHNRHVVGVSSMRHMSRVHWDVHDSPLVLCPPGHPHFIAACKHNKLKHIEQRQPQFPLTTGYAPKRWQQGIEVMLLKQPNNFHVNKLRAILLFEADFNHNNKRIGRALMQHAKTNGWMAPEQYGSRKQLSAIDHCLNKRLSFDIIRQYRKPAAVCANDMKGCYDRIVHSVASSCMQRMGVNVTTLRSMFFTLQHLEHFIRTANGVSEQLFQAKNIHPIAIQGIGQGNGAGPQIWAAISTVELDMLRQQGMGGVFETPITKKQLHIVGYAYVDDTDILTFTGKDDEKETIQKMQENIDLWSGGLAATGGQLEPRKTYWYNINFKWQQGKWRYATKQEATVNLTTMDHNGWRTSLEQVDISEGRRTLGVRLAPDGNNREEFKYLKTQADQWADKIRSGMIPKGFTWQAFTSTILAKLAYAIPAATLTQEECQQITTKLVVATLTKAGINQHLPRDLVFGHESRQGLGFPDLYVWQGAEAVARTLRFGTVSDNITGRLVNTSYEFQCRLSTPATGGLQTVGRTSHGLLHETAMAISFRIQHNVSNTRGSVVASNEQ